MKQMSKMTSTTLESIIFYAGTMRYLINQDPNRLTSETPQETFLKRYSIIRATLTPEMREILFELGKIYSVMKSSGTLGITPVMTPYKRLPPLFYHLSETKAIYYTIEDRLETMKKIQSPATAEELQEIEDTTKEITKLEDRQPLPHQDRLTLARLIETNRLRQSEQDGKLFTHGCSNKIEHRYLPKLTPAEREALHRSPAGEQIIATRKSYSTISFVEYTLDNLLKDDTVIREELAPIFNNRMSMMDTFRIVEKRELSIVGGKTYRPFDNIVREYVRNQANINSLYRNSNPETNNTQLTAALEDLITNARSFTDQVIQCAPIMTLTGDKLRIWQPRGAPEPEQEEAPSKDEPTNPLSTRD